MISGCPRTGCKTSELRLLFCILDRRDGIRELNVGHVAANPRRHCEKRDREDRRHATKNPVEDRVRLVLEARDELSSEALADRRGEEPDPPRYGRPCR